MIASPLEDTEWLDGGESASERLQRLRREAEIIGQAQADIDAGLGIANDDMEAWLDRLESDPETPLPARLGFARRL